MKLLQHLIPIVLLPLLVSCTSQISEEQFVKHANRIHDQVMTIDSHTDTPMHFTRKGFNFEEQHDASRMRYKIDLPGMKDGRLDGVYFAAFIGQNQRNDTGNLKAKLEAMMICDSIHAIIDRYSDDLELATEASDLKRISGQGKHAIYIGLENGYPIGNDLTLIDTFYNLGVRYITLCHTMNNDICDSSTDTTEHGGLSEFGKDVVQRMNQLGVMIDLSHASDKSFFDVLELTTVPVIASHSCSRAICNNPRNLNDEMLLALKENGGVIQMCLVNEYVKEPEPDPKRDSAKNTVVLKHGNYYDLDHQGREAFIMDWYAVDREFPPKLASVSDVVDHIDHIVEVAGIDHVGFGSDFDGGGAIEGCYDVSEIGNITIELCRRGYSKKEIAKIWGGNLTRVFIEVENGTS